MHASTLQWPPCVIQTFQVEFLGVNSVECLLNNGTLFRGHHAMAVFFFFYLVDGSPINWCEGSGDNQSIKQFSKHYYCEQPQP